MTALADSTKSARSSAYADAVARLASAQKPGHGVPAYTRYVNRPLGRRLAALAHLARLTPNQVTVISGAVSLAGLAVLVLLPAGPVVAVVVAFALLLGYALDSADGQLARLRGGGTPVGEWLDHVVDAARVPAVHAAVLVALYRADSGVPVAFLLVPLGFLLVAVVRFFTMMLTDQMVRRRPGGVGLDMRDLGGSVSRAASLRRSVLGLPVDFGLLAAVFVLPAGSTAFAVAYGGLFAVNAAWLVLTLARRHADVAALTETT